MNANPGVPSTLHVQSSDVPEETRHSMPYDLPSEHESQSVVQDTVPAGIVEPCTGAAPEPEALRQVTALASLPLALPRDTVGADDESRLVWSASMHFFIASVSAWHGLWPPSQDAEGRQSSRFSIAGAQVDEASVFCTDSLQSLSH